DTNLHETQTYTDVLGRIVYTINYNGLSSGTLTAIKLSTSAYNVLNKPTSVKVIDEAPQTNQTITGVTTTATYDSLGRELTLADPDRGTHTFTYDGDSRVTTDTVGTRVVGKSYDLLGRVGCVQNAAATISASGACTSSTTPYVVNTYDATPGNVTWS